MDLIFPLRPNHFNKETSGGKVLSLTNENKDNAKRECFTCPDRLRTTRFRCDSWQARLLASGDSKMITNEYIGLYFFSAIFQGNMALLALPRSFRCL